MCACVIYMCKSLPLSKHESRFGLSLIIRGRRAADDDGSPAVATQRVLKNPGHLTVSVRNIGLTEICIECYSTAKGMGEIHFIYRTQWMPGLIYYPYHYLIYYVKKLSIPILQPVPK